VTQAPAGAASHYCAGNSRFFADLIEAGFINNKLTLNDLVEDGFSLSTLKLRRRDG
jgi:hypothetical protein